MADVGKPGDVVGDKFTLVRPLGAGRFGTVWEATDRLGRAWAVKLYRKDSADPSFYPYFQHLVELYGRLEVQRIPGVSLPIEVGETNEYAYAVFEYATELRPLGDLVASGPLPPSDTFRKLAAVAAAVARLHANGIVHADLKPSNILVSGDAIRLIDFGMARQVEPDESLLLVGTWAYMHPFLSAGFESAPVSDVQRVRLSATLIGPYLDIYAMGVLTLELLTGATSVPTPLTEGALQAILRERNPWFRAADRAVVGQAVSLLFRMLRARPQAETITATDIASAATSVAGACSALEAPTAAPQMTPTRLVDATAVQAGLTTAVAKIELLREELMEATGAFLVKQRETEAVPGPNEDAKIRACLKVGGTHDAHTVSSEVIRTES